MKANANFANKILLKGKLLTILINAKKEEEHYLLPMANSPRAGVCGYEPTNPMDKLF